MALINAALERRIPIFAICRGLQELVVATGGTLYRRLFEQPELLEHREDPELPVEQQYARLMKFRFRKEDCCLS
jgi:gamma-glutamyl-gamma-aminobutyrate hydrolase